MAREVRIDPLSKCSLRLELSMDGNPQQHTATGFVIKAGGRYHLITNWHVVTGRHPDTNENIEDGWNPTEVTILHHAANDLDSWTRRTEPLYTRDGDQCWLEHPLGRPIDVIALPLQRIDMDIAIYPMELSLFDQEIIATPAMPASIIGYPSDLTKAGGWPIWKTGHIASDPDIDFKDPFQEYRAVPAFLIDAITRRGMSGSPVVLRLAGGYYVHDGNSFTGYVPSGPPQTRFLGVLSAGMYNKEIGLAEISLVWRPQIIYDICGIDKIAELRWHWYDRGVALKLEGNTTEADAAFAKAKRLGYEE